MRAILSRGLIAMALSFVIACDGSGAGTDPTGICICLPGEGIVTAAIDGQAFTAIVPLAIYYPDQGYFVFSADASNQSQLYVYSPARVGQDSVSPVSASGSFSFTMVAMPGTPATGTRQVSGTFNVKFVKF